MDIEAGASEILEILGESLKNHLKLIMKESAEQDLNDTESERLLVNIANYWQIKRFKQGGK